VRRQSLVASVVLTASLVTLVALPGAAGSQTPSSVRPLTAAAFQKVRLPASDDGSLQAVRPLDAGNESAGHLDDTAPLIEPGDYAPPAERATVILPASVLWTLAAPTPAATPNPTPRPAAKPVSKPAPTTRPTTRPTKTTTGPSSGYKRVLTGLASWYDNGTTAMRLPHGTHIRICGAKGCVSRVVRDWGPARYLSDRIVDMTPEDFVAVTGRGLGAGLAKVTVYIF
jgi:hypothetical protein